MFFVSAHEALACYLDMVILFVFIKTFLFLYNLLHALKAIISIEFFHVKIINRVMNFSYLFY